MCAFMCSHIGSLVKSAYEMSISFKFENSMAGGWPNTMNKSELTLYCIRRKSEPVHVCHALTNAFPTNFWLNKPCHKYYTRKVAYVFRCVSVNFFDLEMICCTRGTCLIRMKNSMLPQSPMVFLATQNYLKICGFLCHAMWSLIDGLDWNFISQHLT